MGTTMSTLLIAMIIGDYVLIENTEKKEKEFI